MMIKVDGAQKQCSRGAVAHGAVPQRHLWAATATKTNNLIHFKLNPSPFQF